MSTRSKLLLASVSFGVLMMPVFVATPAHAVPLLSAASAVDTLSPADASFLKRAIMSDHAAIDAGNVALKNSSSDRLKEIAKTVVDTHTQMLEQLETEAKSAGITAPDGASPMAKAQCSKLEALHGKALDEAFIHDMINLHESELKGFRAEANGNGPESLKKISQDQVPLIEQHLTDLKGIQKNGL